MYIVKKLVFIYLNQKLKKHQNFITEENESYQGLR